MIKNVFARNWGACSFTGSREYLWLLYLAPPAIFAFMFLWRARGRLLWLDEFFTLTLMGASDFGHLWEGIAIGIDCNPPLYIASSWIVTGFIFPNIAPEIVLRALNAVYMILFLVTVFKIMRRFVSLPASVIALLIGAYGWNIIWPAQEVRHYSLFLFIVGLSTFLLLQLVSSRERAAWGVFSVAVGLLVLSHTFGIVYAGAIVGSAALVGMLESDRTLLNRALISGAAALLVFAAWSPMLLSQAALATPYGWIQAPSVKDLIEAFYLSTAAKGSLALSVPLVLLSANIRNEASESFGSQWSRQTKAILMCGALVTCATILVWLVSVFIYPIFVKRYFIPNTMFSFAPLALASAIFLRSSFAYPWVAHVVAAALMLGDSALYTQKEAAASGNIVCMEEDGLQFAELTLEAPNLPIVTESPHAWLPRTHYISPRYLLALDWEVVEKYPGKSVNNAVDYNIMLRIRDWGGVKNILQTSEILAAHKEFLVLDQPDYSWLEHLRLTRSLTATPLGEAGACRLWHVKMSS